MKFSNFIFPESQSPDTDYEILSDALREAELSEELGFEYLWLGEHHFDGTCSYADPMTFAAAVVARTKRAKIGFAAVQTALHHPIRLAEQVALLDNLSQGRIILGTTRGTAFNFYEYRGYGVTAEEAQERLIETEEILHKVWTTSDFKHEGKHWKLELPTLRPKVYQKPHPLIVRAVASEKSLLDMARRGRPFMMVLHPYDVTQELIELYRKTMAESGYDDDTIARNMENSWIWRNVVVAETDEEAEAVGLPAFETMKARAGATRSGLLSDQEKASISGELGGARHTAQHGLIAGSPATVCEKLEELEKFGIGGLIIHFRLGPMSWDANENSLCLFAQKVAPEFHASVAS